MKMGGKAHAFGYRFIRQCSTFLETYNRVYTELNGCLRFVCAFAVVVVSGCSTSIPYQSELHVDMSN